MPARYTDEVANAAIRQIEGQTEDEIRAFVYKYSVRKSTLDSYRSDARRLRRWMATMLTASTDAEGRWRFPAGPTLPPVPDLATVEEEFIELGRQFTPSMFMALIRGHVPHFNLQYRRIRATLRLAQLMAGCTVWASEPQYITAEKAGYHARQGFIPDSRRRGTLTLPMATALFRWAEKRNPAIAEAMQVQFYAGLRISELVSLTRGSIREEGVALINTKRNRVNTLTSANSKMEIKRLQDWKEGARALHILNGVKEQTAGDDSALLFPRSKWTIKSYNEMIRHGARALRFPSALKFDGSHVLRHGGVGTAVARFLKLRASITQMRQALLMSEAMICHYALSNQERLTAVKTPESLKDLVSAAAKKGKPKLDSDNEDSDLEAEELDEELEMATASVRHPTPTPLPAPAPAMPRSRQPAVRRERSSPPPVAPTVASRGDRYHQRRERLAGAAV